MDVMGRRLRRKPFVHDLSAALGWSSVSLISLFGLAYPAFAKPSASFKASFNSDRSSAAITPRCLCGLPSANSQHRLRSTSANAPILEVDEPAREWLIRRCWR
jgi:hypothetical protein